MWDVGLASIGCFMCHSYPRNFVPGGPSCRMRLTKLSPSFRGGGAVGRWSLLSSNSSSEKREHRWHIVEFPEQIHFRSEQKSQKSLHSSLFSVRVHSLFLFWLLEKNCKICSFCNTSDYFDTVCLINCQSLEFFLYKINHH